MHHLALALLPPLARLHAISHAFAGDPFRILLIHLMQTCGVTPASARPQTSGLAPWQIRRAKAVLLEDLRAARSLAEVALACGLSKGHFARAFRAATGVPPHRWLVRCRVERARELLETSDDSLSEIALTCGFADQSHLTRVFRSVVGVSPGAWRRQRRA